MGPSPLPILVVLEPSQHAGLPNVLGYRIAFSHGKERQFLGPAGTSFPAVCTATQNTASPLARQKAQAGITHTAYIITFNYDHSSLTYKNPLDSTDSQRRATPAPVAVTTQRRRIHTVIVLHRKAYRRM